MLFIYSTKRHSQHRPDLDFGIKYHYGHGSVKQQIFIAVSLMLVRKITQIFFFLCVLLCGLLLLIVLQKKVQSTAATKKKQCKVAFDSQPLTSRKCLSHKSFYFFTINLELMLFLHIPTSAQSAVKDAQ